MGNIEHYKCSICSAYNLCDDCEEKNSQTGDHPHAFIKLRKEETNNFNNNNNNFGNINNNNFNNNFGNMNMNNLNNKNINNPYPNFDNKKPNRSNNNKDDDEFRLIQFGEKYSFECVNKHDLKGQIEEGEDEIKYEIIIKNNGTSQWPLKGAKLLPNEEKNIKGEEIILDPLKPGEQKKYNAKFDELKRYPSGNYCAGFIFEINGKKIGDNIDLDILITERKEDENKNKIEDFRNEYSLGVDEYSDEQLLNVLKENNFDKGRAFSSLFD